MVPLRDENPTRHFAWATFSIIVLNVLVFIAWEPSFGRGSDSTFFLCHALVPFEVVHHTNLAQGGAAAVRALSESFGPGTGRHMQVDLTRACARKSWWFSIFAAMFMHAGWVHIAGNMLFLWIFGNNVEDRIGRIRFALFYLAGGVVAMLAQVAVDPGSAVPNLGASGAIAAVLGAYLVMFPRRRVLTLVAVFIVTWVYVPAALMLALWFALQFASGLLALGKTNQGGVAFWAHIGGFVFGVLVAFFFFPRESIRTRPPPPRPDFAKRKFPVGRKRPWAPPPIGPGPASPQPRSVPVPGARGGQAPPRPDQ